MGTGRAAIEEEGARLEVSFDTAQVTHFGLWLNRGGWSPFARGKGYRNLAFEPCMGAPDSLTEALGQWRSANWLEPGQTREWTLTWRALKLL
jgi:galactose mutarotase-like enzyme